MSQPKKPSSSAPQSEPTATPDSTRPTLSPKQRRMADGTLAILRAVQANQEREAMDQAQEVIARAAQALTLENPTADGLRNAAQAAAVAGRAPRPRPRPTSAPPLMPRATISC